MAGRTQVPQVFAAVVQPVSIDVVDLQDESSAPPEIADAARSTLVRDTQIIKGASQKRGSRPGCGWGQPSQYVHGGLAVRGRGSEEVALACEVVG